MCSFIYSVLKNSFWLLVLFSRTLLLSTVYYLCLYLWKNILLQMCRPMYLPHRIIQYQLFRFMNTEREFPPPSFSCNLPLHSVNALSYIITFACNPFSDLYIQYLLPFKNIFISTSISSFVIPRSV